MEHFQRGDKVVPKGHPLIVGEVLWVGTDTWGPYAIVAWGAHPSRTEEVDVAELERYSA